MRHHVCCGVTGWRCPQQQHLPLGHSQGSAETRKNSPARWQGHVLSEARAVPGAVISAFLRTPLAHRAS